MNLPIARGLRGLIYVLWELSQVDPSDLSMLFAGSGRLRIGFADIDAADGQEPGDDDVERAARRCWDNPYYAFGKPPGTSLVCIQGEWSNVVDARLKGRLATLAMDGQTESAYTPLYARATHSPRPWGVTMLVAEHTGVHQPLDVDWSFARTTQRPPLAAAGADRFDRRVASSEDTVAPPSTVSPTVPSRPAPTPTTARKPELANSAAPFVTLLEFAVAVNRSDPAALALAAERGLEIPVDGAEVRKLLGTLWFRGVVPRLSTEWRTRLFDALCSGAEFSNHLVKVGRQQKRLSTLTSAQLGEVAATRSPADVVRQDVELLAAVARVWGDDAIRQLPFREVAAPAAVSGLSGLLQGIRTRL